ncbi:arsenate reductase [Brevundimonas variabilis]|uniref:Arsenate reductase n=1 Tax=Brevundimonas variabilis TaxID=74312 RepID=A0A7W9CIG1_9CAUL|nr:arsenate reductase [Brevundimonas variabilis]
MSSDVTIWHNPACGTSRNTLAIIRAAGVEPTVVVYLKVGWDSATLQRLVDGAGQGVRGLLREKGTPAGALGLLDPDVEDAVILAAMVEHSILVNRPIVETPKGVRLCRPSEVVLDILENPPSRFAKEDGEIVSL